MDRRNWPWRKKSSDKTASVTESIAAPSTAAAGNQEEPDNAKEAVKYVQLTEERYAHLSGLEDHVKVLNEKLSTAQSELNVKENLVKQHTKVAEEAVSGWEKAEAEALALKNQLEAVTLLKLTVEERAAHLDGALKECMKQVRSVKEEGEQKLHDVVFAKTKQWENVKLDFEAKINAFEQELLRSSAENDALSRSLQERSNMLMKISEEKSQAEEEIEVLKTNIQSCEREVNTLKYEVHIVSKELEIRNEEKNMSVRAADVANKQHLEDVKKITKLEAECQRLRALVRKKLPGPAALAQMKMEVERDYGDSRLRRSPIKSPSLHMGMGLASDFAFENFEQYQKENEFLTARLLATEEETKMLKEALSKRNSELQASRNMFSKTASKLQTLETQMVTINQNRSPSKFNTDISIENFPNHINSKPPSITSMSEDGIDDEGSCGDSCATAPMSDLSHFKKEKDGDKSSKAGSSNHLELMDDFLEMEKLACLSAETKKPNSTMDGGVEKSAIENSDESSPVDICNDSKLSKNQPFDADLQRNTSNVDHPAEIDFVNSSEQLSKLQSKIALLFEPHVKDANVEKVLEDIKCIVKDVHGELSHNSESSGAGEAPKVITLSDEKLCSDINRDAADQQDVDEHEGDEIKESNPPITENLKVAIICIHDFVLSVGYNFDAPKIEEFSSAVHQVLSCDTNIDSFILSLSSILSGVTNLGSRIFNDNKNDRESSNSDCIDKVALLENNAVQHEHKKDRTIHSSDELESVQKGQGPDCELKESSMEEIEQLKQVKDDLATDLARCSEALEQTKTQLLQTEQELAGLQLELGESRKSNGLTETQLKCMAESYRSLECRSHGLENEINQLRLRAETLDKELQEERHAHQEDLAKLNDLRELAERNRRFSVCSQSSEADADVKIKQDKEIAAAAEKLAECQETIFLLGKQLKSMRPQPDSMGLATERHDLSEDMGVLNGLNLQPRLSDFQSDNAEMENATSPLQKPGGEFPSNGYGNFSDPNETESSTVPMSPFNPKSAKHGSSRSSTSPADEQKHGRGFSRFFSKGKSNH